MLGDIFGESIHFPYSTGKKIIMFLNKNFTLSSNMLFCTCIIEDLLNYSGLGLDFFMMADYQHKGYRGKNPGGAFREGLSKGI